MRAAATVENDILRALGLIYANTWSNAVNEVLLAPARNGTQPRLEDVLDALGEALPSSLLPLAVVDDESLACVVLESGGVLQAGEVRRFLVRPVAPEHQLALLDIHPLLYITSLEEELSARGAGLRRVLDEIGPAYEHSHLDKEKRPRDYVVRPVRIACQNVIVGLAAISQDSTFDGLSVPAWQTCEVPHVATHEANRALAALTLCDAFQNGGTMEVRFDRKAKILHKGKPRNYDGHPESGVPASLRRFGRTVGVALGAEDPAAITPQEARELFLAITPMPGALRARVQDAVTRRGITPERVCFLLLSQVWREVEMDWLLATTDRAGSILSGGADWRRRDARQAESETCRAAVMIGMLFRRLNATDAASIDSQSAVRVVEDRTKGVTWTVHPQAGAVTFAPMSADDQVPWAHGLAGVAELTVFPRSTVTPADVGELSATDLPGHKALLVPSDVTVPPLSTITVLRCPDRLADVDKNIEDRLLKARISRG